MIEAFIEISCEPIREFHGCPPDPGTALWTVAEVNALQAGIVLDSTNWFVRVTRVSVSVTWGDFATYAYGSTGMNLLTSLTDEGVATSLAYDWNGNLVSRSSPAGKTCYEWNPEHLMTKVRGVSSSCTEEGALVQSYLYDGLGRRVNATTGSAWTVSIYGGGMDPIFETNETGAVTKYVYANGMRIAKINPDDSVYHYVADHLGSTRKVLRSDRSEAFSTEYEPFGKPYAVTGAEAYKYTMEKHDDPTGLVYLRARQYDPEIGRFVSADPVLGMRR